MSWNRIYALFVARNLEFFRDRTALAWSILLPVLILLAFAYAFSNENPEKFKVGITGSNEGVEAVQNFKSTRYIKFIELESADSNLAKVERHQIDLLFDANSFRYWINKTSPNGYIAEKLLVAAFNNSTSQLQKNVVSGDEVRYLDWVVPGVIAMNIMWGALFGY